MDKQALFKPLSNALTGKSGKGDRGGGEKVEHRERMISEDGTVVEGDIGEKRELKQRDAMQYLGYSWSTWRKWQILFQMFLIQISINLNASLYANGVGAISEEFGISKQAARVPQLTFLVAYAFGCELWAPWSEEYGRWPIQQLSLLLVNIWQIPCAFAPNYATLVVCRALGGLSTAGGSVTLGVVADMWLPDDQEYAIAFLVLSSVGGSVVGAVIGGPLEAGASLKWIFWTQLIVGGWVQIMHFFLVPETRSTILLDREAKRRRKSEEDPNIYGPNEINKHKLTMKELLVIWGRPFHMLFTEPIIAWLSAVSGFSDALIFTFLQGFTPVYAQWGFNTVTTSMAFLPLLIGYFLAYLSFLPSIHYFRQKRRRLGSKSVPPEARMWWLRYVILFEPIGLMIFTWTSLGPPVHWIGSMVGVTMVGIANYSIYFSSIDYTVAAYGVYAASATGGNDFARDCLSGIAALYSVPMYENIGGKYHLQWASLILACVAILVTTPIFYFYANGEKIRKKSKFAAQIQKERDEEEAYMNEKKGGSGAEARVEQVEP